MDISIKIFVPFEEFGDNNIKEYILRLFSSEYQCFGEPIIATCHLDNDLYNSTVPEGDDINYPRVTDSKEFVENFQIAKELSQKGKEPFTKVLRDLKRAEDRKMVS